MTLLVNTQEKGETVAILRGNDVLVKLADLERVGIHGVRGVRETVGRDEYVALSSLAPSVTFTFDEKNLSLALTADTKLFHATAVNLGYRRPENLVYSHDRSAVFNYAGTLNNDRKFTGFAETAVSAFGALFYSSAIVQPQYAARGITRLTIDNRTHLRRTTIGDIVTGAVDLGGSALLGGLSLAREVALDPYTIRFPTPALTGSVLTPSTAEVYVNGVLVRRIPLPPGPFNLNNVPVSAGNNATQVIIRDVFGREQGISVPYYASTGVLRRGLNDYAFAYGALRQNAFTDKDRYGGGTFSSRYRIGVTDSVTGGARAESSARFFSAGPVVDIRSRLGDLHFAAGASRQNDRSGQAGSFAYNYLGRRASFGGAITLQSPGYANLSQAATDDRALVDATAFGSSQLGRRASVTVTYAHRVFRDSGSQVQGTLGGSLQVNSRANIILLAAHTQAKGSQRSANDSLFASFNLSVGPRTTESVGVRSVNGQNAATLQYQRSPPVGVGFGQRAQVDMGPTALLNGLLLYHGQFGNYELSYETAPDKKFTTSITASGGVAAIGGRLHATRPISDSFALVQVPGIKGVHTYLDNQDVGRTDAKGDLLVPGLISNYGNRISILDLDAPLNSSIESVDEIVAPPERSGALVRFPVRIVHAFVGKLIVDLRGTPVVPAYGELEITVKTRKYRSEIGERGEFYLENVPPGLQPARVLFKEGECLFTMDLPVTSKPSANLGTVRCVSG